jgi:putative transposase
MAPTGAGSETKALGLVVQIDEGKIQAHLDEVVRSTVEETLNALLDAEADRLCGARRYERSEGRKDTRAGSYDRQLQTKAGEKSLKVPKLRSLPFETTIIERYRRREPSVEEALVEMYLAGVSVRRVEDSTKTTTGSTLTFLLPDVMVIADEVDSQLAQAMASYVAESKTEPPLS